MTKYNSILALLMLFTFISSAQWQTVTVNNSLLPMQDVSVADEFNVWAISLDTIDNIYRSSDGGVTWLNAGFNVSERLDFISAVSSSTAWVATTWGKIYRTTNGGLNWVNQPYSHEEFVNFIHFYDENNGVFLADATAGSDTVGFFYTRNGGVNWIRSANAPVIQYSLALLEGCANTLDTNLIWFGASVGSNVYKLFKLTGGFQSQWQVMDYGTPGSFRHIVFKDPQNGLAAAMNKIIVTTNGGLNWSLRNSDVSSSFIREFFRVPQTDWVVYYSGNQLKLSKDFCLSWFTQTNYSGAGYGAAGDTNSIWLTTHVTNSIGTLLKYNILAIGIIGISSNVTNSFKLGQNYPNPFNPVTTITFSVPADAENDRVSNVLLQVYDVQGRLVETLVDNNLKRGEYSINWNGDNFASGVYYYKLIAGSQIETRKMVLLK